MGDQGRQRQDRAQAPFQTMTATSWYVSSKSKGLSAIAARFSEVMSMTLVDQFKKLHAEDLDDLDLSFLKRWQKRDLLELVQQITAASASLFDSGFNDSCLSGADTAGEGGPNPLTLNPKS